MLTIVTGIIWTTLLFLTCAYHLAWKFKHSMIQWFGLFVTWLFLAQGSCPVRKCVLLNGAWAVSSTGATVWFIDRSTVYEDSDAYLEGFRYGLWIICYFILSTAAAPAWTLALPAAFQILMLFSPRTSVPVVLFIFLSLTSCPALCISMMSDQRRAFGREVCC